jgi:molybdopterin/thiamine biosynthesis adenylyltransferase/rhodanese-related sulfurtransferase
MLTREEYRRYSRHLILPEVTLQGQMKLKSSGVLLVGLGGLGSPLGLYLAAAGVGRLGLVDFDMVDLSNLQRQVLYETRDVGRSKCAVAKKRLQASNPHVQIVPHDSRLNPANAREILADYDIIVDGTDNFPTRYLLNDVCVFMGKPLVYGGVFQFEGQVTVFDSGHGPCYRCLYPAPPPPEEIPSCADGGVFGALPGIIGAIQAVETIKLIIGKGDNLIGRLLHLDGLTMRFQEFALSKNPQCPVCGANPSITEPVDYEMFCGGGDESHEVVGAIPEMRPNELRKKLEAGEPVVLVDVREPHEWDISSIGGHRIPLGEFSARIAELDAEKDKHIVVYCRDGIRSAKAAYLLEQVGFRDVWNLEGGINSWADEVDPTMPIY